MAITQIQLPGSTTPIDINDARISVETSTIGSATQPVYLNNGVITPITHTIAKSVPSDAVFTDTNQTLTVEGATFAATAAVNLTAGSNVTLSTSGNTVTIAAEGSSYEAGTGISISGSTISVDTSTIQSKLSAGNGITITNSTIGTTYTAASIGNGLTVSASALSVDTDTIQAKLTQGSNVQISGNVISATDTTYSAGKNITITDTTISSGITIQSGAAGFYLAGSSSQPGSPAVIDTVYGTSSLLYDTTHGLISPKVQVGTSSNGCRMEYDSTNKKLTFTFT